MSQNNDDLRALAASAVDDAAATIRESQKAAEAAKELTGAIKVAFDDGSGSWQSGLKAVATLAKEVHEGKSLVSKEKIAEIVTEINEQMHADRMSRGLMVGGKFASEETARVTDTWDKAFDYTTFQFHTRQVDPRSMKQADLMELAMSTTPRNDVQRGFQHAYMDLMIVDAYMRARKRTNYRGHRAELPKMTALCDYYRAAMWADITQKAALDPNDVTDTADWVPVVTSPDFRELLTLNLRVEALFEHVPYTGPSATWTMPLDNTNAVGDLVPPTGTGVMGFTYTNSNPFAGSDPIQMGHAINDGKKVYTFQMHRGRAMFNGALDEDSIIPMLPRARMNILKAIARAGEKAIIDGQYSVPAIDTGDTAYYTGGAYTTAAYNDARHSWDGLRKHIAVQTSVGLKTCSYDSNGNITVSKLLGNVKSMMGKYGINPSDNAFILSVNAIYHILVDTAAVYTMDKFGPQATVMTGAIAQVGGSPVIVSEFVRTDLNASGIYDNSLKTKTVALCVHKPSFLVVEKRGIEIGADYYRATDVTDVVGMRRLDFGKWPGDAEVAVASAYNIPNT
jgi:hypothetical protein